MRVDRCGDLGHPGLHGREEAQQGPLVVGLGEALAVQDPAPLQLGVRQQEAVGRDEVDPRVVRPAGEQLAQHARRGALADRDAAGDPDDERHPAAHGAGSSPRKVDAAR